MRTFAMPAARGWAMIVVAALLAWASPTWAQLSVSAAAQTGPNATRAALTAAAADAERRGDRATAAVLRERLAVGDLRPGDRLVVQLTTDTIARYEFVVRDSQRVDVPPLGSVSLRGVLRSELQSAMQRFYTQYYRNPQVRVEPLIRIGVMGAVANPGFYSVPPDMPVADVLRERAGGTAGNARMDRIEIKRGGERVVDRGSYQRAARDGLTFDDLNLRSGDEIQVPGQNRRNWWQTVRIVTSVIFALVAVLGLIRRLNE
jgi:protein involved in polysaccharide export with SLBB domain